MTHSELCPRRLTRLVDWSKWKNPLWRSSYHKIFTRIHPSTHTFANSDILESKNEKNPENAKKIEFVFHLVLLGIIIRKEAKKLLNLQQPIPKHFNCLNSVGVFYLLLLSIQPFQFAQEQNLSTSELNFSVVGWNRQARLNGDPGVHHPHQVNQASEKTSRKRGYV